MRGWVADLYCGCCLTIVSPECPNPEESWLTHCPGLWRTEVSLSPFTLCRNPFQPKSQRSPNNLVPATCPVHMHTLLFRTQEASGHGPAPSLCKRLCGPSLALQQNESSSFSRDSWEPLKVCPLHFSIQRRLSPPIRVLQDYSGHIKKNYPSVSLQPLWF